MSMQCQPGHYIQRYGNDNFVGSTYSFKIKNRKIELQNKLRSDNVSLQNRITKIKKG